MGSETRKIVEFQCGKALRRDVFTLSYGGWRAQLGYFVGGKCVRLCFEKVCKTPLPGRPSWERCCGRVVVLNTIQVGIGATKKFFHN